MGGIIYTQAGGIVIIIITAVIVHRLLHNTAVYYNIILYTVHLYYNNARRHPYIYAYIIYNIMYGQYYSVPVYLTRMRVCILLANIIHNSIICKYTDDDKAPTTVKIFPRDNIIMMMIILSAVIPIVCDISRKTTVAAVAL